VIEELIALAKELREADRRGETLGLSQAELAFYDALETNDSAVKVLGEPTLQQIARKLVETVRGNVTIDWTERANVQANLRRLVKRVLRKYGYPPDKQKQATRTVLEQAELFGAEWAEQAAPAPAAPVATALPFRRVTPTEDEKYRTCVLLLTLKTAAGGFGGSQDVEAEDWVVPETSRPLRAGMFVAQVVGRSMEPLIPNGSWCLFRSPVEGSRQGKVVLVEHRDIHDPETGGSYTVKRYRSRKAADAEGWRHVEIRLEPENPEFAPIVLRESAEGDVRVVAELIEVLKAHRMAPAEGQRRGQPAV
jgi:SOS-response transcriptional repressor LexA